MHNSNANNHHFLKVFLLFLIVFVFSASNDFKKRSSDETNQEIGLGIELKQSTEAVIVSLPKLPPFKVNYSFGLENEFFFMNPELVKETYTTQNIRNKLKLLSTKHLNLKQKLKKQSFFTIQLWRSNIPGYHPA